MTNPNLIIIDAPSLRLIIKECVREEFERAIIRPDPTKFFVGQLSIKEITEMFKITKPTVYAWIERGILKSHKIGNKVYFLKDEVEAGMKNYESNPKKHMPVLKALNMINELED